MELPTEVKDALVRNDINTVYSVLALYMVEMVANTNTELATIKSRLEKTTPLVELTIGQNVEQLLLSIKESLVQQNVLLQQLVIQQQVIPHIGMYKDETVVESVTPVVTPQKKARTMRKGVTTGVTKERVLQFYTEIGEESLRKAATYFGVSHMKIKRILEG